MIETRVLKGYRAVPVNGYITVVPILRDTDNAGLTLAAPKESGWGKVQSASDPAFPTGTIVGCPPVSPNSIIDHEGNVLVIMHSKDVKLILNEL